MPSRRLPRLRRRLRRRLARAARVVRRIGAPRVHGITPDVRALLDGPRGVF